LFDVSLDKVHETTAWSRSSAVIYVNTHECIID
jgi:predicted aconitase